MQNVITNTPPVDSDLLNKKNVSELYKPRLVDVGKPRPAPKPVLVDVGKPKPAPKTKLVNVGKPKLPTIEQLVQQIDSDLNFVPSKNQIKEYFAYKDKQPFGFKKTWDATVNAVGTALGDMTKAVGSAVTDPEFYNPISKRKYVTLAEGFARGSWDLATLGKMMTDKFQEVAGDPSTRERVKYIVKRHNEEYPEDKVSFNQVFYDGNKNFKNPKDYNRYFSDFKDNLTEKRIERWRTMRYILNTRNLAREGKKTILGEFLGEKADKELLPNINQEVAEGSSYFLDPSLPVGLAATPLKAGQKSVVTRGITAPVLEKSGRRIKETGKWIDETIAKLETKAAENADIVEPAATGASAIGGAVLAPESVGPIAGAVAGAVGGKYGLPKLGTVTKIGKPITIAGEGIEAIGKVIGKPETLESTLQQASRIAESESSRNILKKAANLDPAITLVDNLAVGTIEGSKAGGILTLPSGEEEFIGGGIGTGGAMGGFGSVSGNVIGDKSRTQQQAKNTVEAWIESKSKDERKAIQDLRLSPIEAANVAMAELLGRGIIGDGKISDINFVYLSQPEYIKKIHPELMIDGKAPDVLPVGTRGAQSSVDGTPTVFINSGYDGPRSIFHEMMHGMLKFDEMSDSRTELRSVLFDQKTDDGTVLKEGMYSDGDIDVFFDQYLSRLPEEMRGSWEEQFNVLREEGAEKTLVTDKEATLDAKRQYIMEEVEAESFANFIKESGPTFLRGSRTIRQRIVDRFLLQDNLKKTRLLRAVLEKSGVPFGADGNPTGVFWKDGKPISNNRELNRVMRDFVRAKDSVTRRMMEDEGGETPSLSIGAKRKAEGRKKVEIALKSKDGKLLVSHFKNNDTFKREKNGEIKYDALTGEPILLGEKEIQALQENRANQIQDALDAIGIDPSGMTPKESKVDGKISWSGIPSDAQLKAILDIPNDIIPPGMKDTITDIVEKMKTPGQSIIIDYNPAMGSGKRYSSNLSSGLRIAVPLGFNISKSKNFYITTLDLGAMNIKLSDWGNPDSKTHKNLDLWNGDSKLFQQDMFKYLENHKNDRPGESGLDANPATAETKRNIINDFFGATAKDYNPITDARKASKRTGKQRKVENPIRARRLDRVNKIEKNRITKYGAGTPLPMKTQSDAYKKLKENLMPGGGLEPQSSVRPPVDDLGFFSRVEQVAMGDKIPNRGSGDQMLATIKKQPGVKQEELQWLGLEDYLRGKKQVTKQELTDFIRENDIQLEETMFSGDRYTPIDPNKETSLTQYEEYQLPGAEDGSYKEMLLRLPSNNLDEAIYRNMDLFFDLKNPKEVQTQLKFFTTGRKAGDDILFETSPDKIFSRLEQIRNKRGKSNFQSSHFDEPNILAHVRFNDRTGPNGEKILFVEELQSDWHSEGRKRGYGDAERGLDKAAKELDQLLNLDAEKRGLKTNVEPITPREAQEFLSDFVHKDYLIPRIGEENYARLKEMAKRDMSSVPDAPFKSSWHELATKRMLRYAAENGYDKLAFIDGSETANRYDLSKKIDGLELIDNQDGTYEIMVKQVGDDDYKSLIYNIKKDEVSNYIGKEVAKTAFNKMSDGLASLEGLDLKIGGDWAFNLYDRMIPQFLKKYGKKFGAKVEDVEVRLSDPEEAALTGISADEVEATNFKAIDITPQMRGEDGVMGGQVRFMPGALQDSVQAQTNDRPSVGVNINDGQLPFSRWIVDGRQNEDGSIQKKTIETRANPKNNALAKLSKTGERFAIISTFGSKKKQAEIIATAKAGSPIMYDTLEKFRADQDKHMVEPGSDFDWDGFKVGYPIEDVKKLEKSVPVPRNVRGIQTRDLSGVRYMPAERADVKNRVSTRLPTAATATENPLASTLLINNDTVFLLPKEKQDILASTIAKYPHIRTEKRDLSSVNKELQDMSVSNLLWLYDKVPENIRKRSKLWYDGARKITNDWVKKYGLTNAESAGVIAVLSPQKDWFMNVSLAERVIDGYKNKQDFPVNQEMITKAKEIDQFSKDPLVMKVIETMGDKKFNDLDLLEKAYFIRLYDQTYRPQSFPVISPEGRMMDSKVNNDGSLGRVIHASSPAYIKAISILENPTKENISNQLGNQHKVRNFNNNILLPKLAREDVTIDTHAVAAALLKPLSAKSIEVSHNFGSGVPNSSITGGKGTYGIYADAYRKAAEQRGVLPREMQSITWEAVRGLFPQRMKNKKNIKIADGIWSDYNNGKLSLDETRNKISDAFGGIRNPTWYGTDK